MDSYQLTTNEVYEIFHVFRKMDKLGTGYINLDNMYSIIGEEVGIISPYLERLFSLIKKQRADKVNFIEFLPVLTAFCLYTRQQLISFVFCMLDSDHNGFVSKKDMLTFIADERFGLPIFTQNFLLSVDALELERPDRISFEQFLSIEQDILFLIYPVTRLQKGLQKAFVGERLWQSVYIRILKLEKEEEKKNLNFQSDAAKKRRAATAEQKKKDLEDILAKKSLNTDAKLSIKRLDIREARRRGSDSKLNTRLTLFAHHSPKRHRSVVYVKKEFVALEDNDESAQPKGLRRLRSNRMMKKGKNKMNRLPSFQRKDTKTVKSITSLTSGRKKGQAEGRRNSNESAGSFVAGLNEAVQRRVVEKSQVLSIVNNSSRGLGSN